MRHTPPHVKVTEFWLKGLLRQRAVPILAVLMICVLALGAALSSSPVPRTNNASPEAERRGAWKDARVAQLTAPLMALPPLCNQRNMRPLTPRPPEYDPDRFDIVVGIISIDNVGHAGLRQAQRDTWFQYTDVAKPSNGFRGRMRVEYLFGRSFENNFTFSKSLYRESKEQGGVLVMDVREPKRTLKKLLTTGSYGHAAEVTMGLKVLAYYCYAEQTYRRAKFIAKADDDEFIRVPLVMRTMDSLPSHGVLWSFRLSSMWSKKNTRATGLCGTWGIWIAMSRDMLHLINSLDEIQRYGAAEVTEEGLRRAHGPPATFQWIEENTPFLAEDVLPGAALSSFVRDGRLRRALGLRYNISLYFEEKCRMHNPEMDKGWSGYRHHVTPVSMIIHHANRSQQLQYVQWFPEEATYDVTFKPAKLSKCPGTPVMRNAACRREEARKPL